MTANTYRMALEVKAAEALKERLRAEFAADDETIRDMVEGQTDLHWLLGQAAFELAAVEGEKEGIEGAIAKMKERLTRHCRRAEALRSAIAAAMEAAELLSFKTAAATLSMRASPPRVEIADPAVLPDEFLTYPPPIPDKNKVKAALKDGTVVIGAFLSNQPPSLSVRFT